MDDISDVVDKEEEGAFELSEGCSGEFGCVKETTNDEEIVYEEELGNELDMPTGDGGVDATTEELGIAGIDDGEGMTGIEVGRELEGGIFVELPGIGTDDGAADEGITGIEETTIGEDGVNEGTCRE